MEKLQSLLRHVQTIVNKNNEILDASGERFNVFNLLGVTSSELAHSAFLAELLDPKGAHGLKHRFLESFLSHTFPENNFCFDCDSAGVFKEYYIGPVTENTGGQIDILILNESGKKGIIIENKIWADDQHAQLIRYDNHAKRCYPDGYKIIYLTPDGNDPKEYSCGKGEKKIVYTSISYREHILAWLDECMAIASKYPHVRETISQYMGIIKQLTNQDISMNTNDEIFDLLFSRPENLEMALKIKNTMTNDRQEDIAYEQLAEIASELDIRIEDQNTFVPPGWVKNRICFSFEGPLLYGICRREPDKSRSRLPEIENYLGGNWRASEWWPMYQSFYPALDPLWIDLANGKFKEKAKEFVSKIVNEFGSNNSY